METVFTQTSGPSETVFNSASNIVTSNQFTGGVMAGGFKGADGQGVPTGGAANQVLSKIDATNYNTQWVTGGGGGTAPDATTTIKGIVQLAGDLGGTAALPTVPALASKATDTAVVHLAGAETVTGAKTFSGSIAVSGTVDGRDVSVDGTKLDGIASGAQVNTISSVNTRVGAVTGLAEDSAVVKLTGNQDVAGNKNLTGVTNFSNNGQLINIVGTDHSYVAFYPQGVASGRKAYFGFPTIGSNNIQFVNEVSGGHISFATVGTGNVGIGTVDPKFKLTVSGGYQTTGLTNATNEVSIAAGGATAEAGQVVWGDNGGWKLHFGTRNLGNFVERVTFLDTGNVGIGNPAPTSKLDVVGNIAVSGTVDGRDVSVDGTRLDVITDANYLNSNTTKVNVGLANVDNTTDLNKPISTATQTALDTKSATTHAHSLDNLSDVIITTPAIGQVVKFNGTNWINDTDATGAGGTNATNLTTTAAPTTVTINSDTGTDAIVAATDATNAGVFLPAEKTKLTGIATGATANDTDANLKARANHTGTQVASTISDFATATAATAAVTANTAKNSYPSADATKLSGIEALADVTDATNVTAAGAIMDGDFVANGSMTRTASGTYVSRVLASGNLNFISITNGDGVAGNPTVDIGPSVAEVNGTQTLTNKRINNRVTTPTLAASTYTIDGDASDVAKIGTAPTANFTIAAPTGTPTTEQKLELVIVSGATGFVPTWPAIFMSSTDVTLPTTALTANKRTRFGFIYDSTLVKWVLIAKGEY